MSVNSIQHATNVQILPVVIGVPKKTGKAFDLNGKNGMILNNCLFFS